MKLMRRWKIAGGLALFAGAIALLVFFAPGVNGQDRWVVAPRADRQVHLAQWLGGSQIGVTVRETETGGVAIEDVRQGSPAEKAGIKEGDVIAEFDGERVRSSRQFARLVDETSQGRSVKMTVLRNGQRTTVDVTPEAREFGRVMPIPRERFSIPDIPELAPTPRLPRDFDHWVAPEIEVYTSRSGSRLGVQIEDVEDQLAEYFGVKRGALVISVSKDSPAARAGFRAGDVITKIGSEAVETASDVRRELRRIDAEKEFPVEVVRDRKPATLKVKLDAPASSSRKPGTSTEWF